METGVAAAATEPAAAFPGTSGTEGTRLRLRGHHLACVFGFRGLGYNDAFVANMRAIVDAFFAGGVQVQVSECCDDLCTACPHCDGEECRSREGAEAQVRENDRRTLAALDLQAGEVHPARELARRAGERLDATALEAICAGCRWRPLGYCAEGLRQHRERTATDRRGHTAG